jgi:hypothetical protein
MRHLLAYARGTSSNFIEGENINEFVRQKNSGRNRRRDGFDIRAFRVDFYAHRVRFSEREESLPIEVRGLSRK